MITYFDGILFITVFNAISEKYGCVLQLVGGLVERGHSTKDIDALFVITDDSKYELFQEECSLAESVIRQLGGKLIHWGYVSVDDYGYHGCYEHFQLNEFPIDIFYEEDEDEFRSSY